MDCLKIKYNSMKSALQGMRKVKRSGKIIPPDTHIYLCPCGSYHLGHNKYYKEKNKFEQLK